MFSRDIRTKLQSVDQLQDRAHKKSNTSSDVQGEMKDYADKNKQSKGSFIKVGDVVHVANMEQSKLDSSFKSTRYVLLHKTSDSPLNL